MGGIGSGSGVGDGIGKAGRRPRAAIQVCGNGAPEKPEGLAADVSAAWDQVAEWTAGVTYSQDSEAIIECARLIVRQRAFAVALESKPLDEELNRLSLAVGRALAASLTALGLNPRGRQLLLVPSRDEPEVDELEELLSGRGIDGTQ